MQLPSDGVWYNEELGISIEFKTDHNSNYLGVNSCWNAEQDLYVNLGYGNIICFYVMDKNNTAKYLLIGDFKYSNDEFVVIASELAEPFEISGELKEANNKKFIFTNQSSVITTP